MIQNIIRPKFNFLNKEFFKKYFLKIIIFICLLSFVLTGFYLNEKGYLDLDKLSSFFQQHQILSPVLLLLLYSIIPSLFLPTTAVNILAGFVWGPWWGGVLAVLGKTLGSALSFLISRYLGKEYFSKKFSHKSWHWVLEKIETHNWKLVAFTRLNPVFPNSIVSYFFGLTTISFKTYIWATLIFIIPNVMVLASFGNSLKDSVFGENINELLFGWLIFLVFLIIIVLSRWILNKFVFNNKVEKMISE